MEKRNTRFKIIGAAIVLALIIGLLCLVNSNPNLDPKKTYVVEIYHCPPIASTDVYLHDEMNELLKSTELPASGGFIAPVVQLHEKLNGGEVREISVPMTGLSKLREFLNDEYYDFLVRKSEEEDLLVKLFSSKNYQAFMSKAILPGDTAVNSVNYDSNNSVTEFFIDNSRTNANSADNKVWNSLASLKVYINDLIAANKIKARSVIKIYYQCGGSNPPVDINGPDGDLDGDAVINKLDECPKEKGEVQCSGCPCDDGVTGPETPKDSDGDGIVDNKDKCPNDFGLKQDDGCPGIVGLTISNGGTVSWSGSARVLYLSVRYSTARDKEIFEAKVENGDKIKIPGVQNTNDQQFYFIKYGRSKGNLGSEITVKCTNFL